jgi:hypothetical protein
MSRPVLIRLALAVILVGIVVGGGYGLWILFLQPPGPAAVNVSTVPIPSIAASGSESLPTTPASFDGTWKVDTSIGSFSDSTSSFVGYRVQEQLANIGANTAVGRTPDVSGTLTLQRTTVTAVEVTANLATPEEQRRSPRRPAPSSGAGDGPVPDGHLQAYPAD